MTANTVTESTPVTVTLPLGLARTIVSALAYYAEHANDSRLDGGEDNDWDVRVLQFIAGANDLVREAATKVEPEFNRGAGRAWAQLAPGANEFLAYLQCFGQLKPEVIAARLGEVETEAQANAA